MPPCTSPTVNGFTDLRWSRSLTCHSPAPPPHCVLPRHPYSHSQEGVSPATQIFLARGVGGEGRDQDCPSRQNLRVSATLLQVQVCHVPLPHYKALPSLCTLSSLPPSHRVSGVGLLPLPQEACPPPCLAFIRGGGIVMLPLPALSCLEDPLACPFGLSPEFFSPLPSSPRFCSMGYHSPQHTPPRSQPTSACRHRVTAPVSGSACPFPPSLLYLTAPPPRPHLYCLLSRSGP